MAFDTYANLQAAVASWMHRKDLTGSIPDFITLTEARIKALLKMRLQNVSDTLGAVQGVPGVSVPTGLIKVRAMSIPNVRPSIEYETPDQFSSQFGDGYAGAPYRYTIIGGQIVFGPTPDASYPVSIVYEAEFVPLSDTVTTNIVLAKWPNVYLWGALKEAANFSRNQPYEASCEAGFQSAINDANLLEWHSGGPMRMRTDTYTP